MSCSNSGDSASNTVASTLTPNEGATTRPSDSTVQQPTEGTDPARLSQTVQDCCTGMSPNEYKKMLSKPTGTAENFLPSFDTENGGVSRETADEYERQQGPGRLKQQERTADDTEVTATTATESVDSYDYVQGSTGSTELRSQTRPQQERSEEVASTTSRTNRTESTDSYEFSQGSTGGTEAKSDSRRQAGERREENTQTAELTPTAPSNETVTHDAEGNKVTEFNNDPKHRTKETRFYDNKHEAQSETEFSGRPDGIVKETEYLNKTESVHKDGTKITEYAPGDRRNPDPFIRKVTETANRKTTSFENHPDDITSITQYKNQKSGLETATHYKDGASEMRYKDGTVKTRSADGTETVSNPRMEAIAKAANRPVNSKDADGNFVTEFKNDPQHRTKETRFYDNKNRNGALSETEFSGREDGIVKETQFLNKKESLTENGTKTTEYTPGDRRNPDPFIRKVTEDKGFKTTTFENQPEGISSITEYKKSLSGLEKATHFKDGSVERRYADGTVKTRDRDGNETASNPRKEAAERAANQPVVTKDSGGNETTEFKNDPQHRTRETRFYDNKNRNGALSQTEFSGRDDGIVRETQFLNRTESVHKDGTKITEFSPGDRRNPDPFVRRVTENAHRTTKTFENHPEGIATQTEYRNQPSGLERATKYKDGRSEFQYRDGTIKTRSADGTETIRNPRAEAEAEAATKPILSTRKDSAGNEVTEIKNDPEKRTRETKFYDRKPRDGAQSETEFSGRPDGLVKETQYLNKSEKIYSTGGKLTTYEAGDRRNPDPFVRTVWEPGSGKFKTTTYENHPDKIAEMTELKNHPQGLQQEIRYTDGSTERRFQDGTVKVKPRNGPEIVRPRR